MNFWPCINRLYLVSCSSLFLCSRALRYVPIPNVAKRSSLYEISVRRSIIEDRPTGDLTLGKISNDHISARGPPIHFMFGSTVGFSGLADRMALIPV